LIEKMHSVSTSDIAILAYPSISCLASSLPSWIIDFGVLTHMIAKSTVFSILHTSSSAPSVVFADGSFKSITDSGTVNLTSSLALCGVNYVPHIPFNLIFVNHLTYTLNYSITFFPSYIIQDLQTRKVIGGSEMVRIIFSAVINLN